jgi:hypothetical protein
MKIKARPFRMKADIIFQAIDVTDAMKLLAKHFTNIKKGVDSKLIEGGEIEVRPSGEPYNRVLLSNSRNIHLEFPVYIPPGCTLTTSVDLYNDTHDTFIGTDVEVKGKSRINQSRLEPEALFNGDIIRVPGVISLDFSND